MKLPIVCVAMYVVFHSNFAAYIVCRRYKPCEFLGLVWTDCWGNKSDYDMNEFHPQCVGLNSSNNRAIWFCFTCRNISRTISNLDQRIAKQDDELKALKECNNALTKTIEEQRQTIANLQGQRIESSTMATAAKVTESPAVNTNTSTTLLIGDSIIKDINPRGLINTDVKCIPGAKTVDIKDHIAAQPALPYDTFILHVGTNDKDLQSASVAMKATLEDISERAPQATRIISTACPRPDSDESQENVQQVNKMLKQTAAANANCMVVDNDKVFVKDEGSIDKNAFKYRSIHLSKSGTKTLLRNINNCHQISKNPLTKSRNSQTRQRRPNNFNNNNNRQGEGVIRQSRFRGQFRPQYHHDYDINSSRTASRATDTRRGCYFCGEQNHQKRSCKFGKPLQCFQCGAFGHKQGMNLCNSYNMYNAY